MTRPRLLAVSVMTALVTFTVYVTTYGFVPVFAASLGASQTDVGVLTTLAQGGFVLGALVAGLAVRRFSPPHLLALGAVLVASAAALVPVSDLRSLPALQLCSGVGRGVVNPVAAALVITGATGGERTTSMGVYQAAWSLGIVLGPPLAGWIADSHGLTPAFGAGAGAALAAALIAVGIARRPA